MVRIVYEEKYKLPITSVYDFIYQWLENEQATIKGASPPNAIDAIHGSSKWKTPDDVKLKKKMLIRLIQVNTFSILIQIQVSVSGGFAFKGLYKRVWRDKLLYPLFSQLRTFEETMSGSSKDIDQLMKNYHQGGLIQEQEPAQQNIESIPSKVEYNKQYTELYPSKVEYNKQNVELYPFQAEYEKKTIETRAHNPEVQNLLKKKVMYQKIIKEAEETDLSFANDDKKDEIRRTLSLYSKKIEDVDKQLQKFEQV